MSCRRSERALPQVRLNWNHRLRKERGVELGKGSSAGQGLKSEHRPVLVSDHRERLADSGVGGSEGG